MNRIIIVTSVTVITGLLSACSLFPRTQSVSDPASVYVWPTSECPSAVKHAGVLGAALGSSLATDAVSTITTMVANALAAAAAADKNGYQLSTNGAVFYDSLVWGNKMVNGKAVVDGKGQPVREARVLPPVCYVVAVARPKSGATSWCDQQDFVSAVGSSCTGTGRSILDDLQNKPNRVLTSFQYPLDLPLFYAEIFLEPSGYAGSTTSTSIVAPTIVSTYYPKSLLGGAIEQGKPKHLSLTITFSSPVQPSSNSNGPVNDPFKGATVNLDILGVTPGPDASASEMASNSHTTWAIVPIDAVPDTTAYHDMLTGQPAPGPAKAVSVTASIHEVGDPNAFLQAFSSSFGSQSSLSSLNTAISAAISPVSTVAAANNSASYSTAESKYLTAVSTYQAECVTLKGDETGALPKVPADRSLLQADLVAADAAFASWQAAQLQYPSSGGVPVKTALTCP